MRNLQELSMRIIESQEVKNSKTSTLDHLLDILYKKDAKSKDELIPIILERRLLEKNDQKYYDKLDESKLNEIVQKEIKTVSNSIDTSVCNGSNNSVFNYNKKYKKYELVKLDNKKFTIIDRK